MSRSDKCIETERKLIVSKPGRGWKWEVSAREDKHCFAFGDESTLK